ncbi:MAG TPA: Asp-tRNA(Asn)/Glu-tRNA(Gln) amidotransferase subunit GatC [Byssovorax sp.]
MAVPTDADARGPAPARRAAFTDDDGRALARLARLALTDAEIARISRDLEGILAYVDQLGELDLEGVPPTAYGQLSEASLRPDVPAPSLPRETALREAPQATADGFAVPSFVDEG